jgi:hypothetical protein
MVWCGPLHWAFADNVTYASINIQQVAEEEEEEEEGDTPHFDTRCNERVWVDFLDGLH